MRDLHGQKRVWQGVLREPSVLEKLRDGGPPVGVDDQPAMRWVTKQNEETKRNGHFEQEETRSGRHEGKQIQRLPCRRVHGLRREGNLAVIRSLVTQCKQDTRAGERAANDGAERMEEQPA